MPELAELLDEIRAKPNEEAHWLALAVWLRDNGRDDEAAAVRVFWPTLRDNVTIGEVSLNETLRQMARRATRLGRRARAIAEQSFAVGKEQID